MMNRIGHFVLLATAAPALFGGSFVLQLGNPAASAEAQEMRAVLTVQAAGCHEPEKAQVTAVAMQEGQGKIAKVPVELKRLSRPGMYGIAKQWPASGRWTLKLTGRDSGRVTTTLVNVEGDNADRTSAKYILGEAGAAELHAMMAQR